jgi:hypothetical protein
MLGFVACLGEIQVMSNGIRLVSGELDGHVEFTPSLLGNTERRVPESCLSKGRPHQHMIP